MPDLVSLDVLLRVSHEGSLSSAARELGMTQQAVSARVASLESQTGVRLVTRSPRGSELTDAGRLVVQWSERLMQVAHEVDAGLSSLRESSRARVRVSASLTVAEQLLPGWLVSLHVAAQRRGEVAPDVELSATNSEHVVDAVRSGDADLGFVEGSRAPRGLRSRVVAFDDLVLVVLPDHRWARRAHAVGAAELADCQLVTRERGSGTREYFESALTGVLGTQAELARPALELSTASSVRAAVLAGAGPAVMSRLAVSDDLAADRLRAIPVEGMDLRRDLRAVWIGGRTPPAGAVRDLLSHIGSRERPTTSMRQPRSGDMT